MAFWRPKRRIEAAPASEDAQALRLAFDQGRREERRRRRRSPLMSLTIALMATAGAAMLVMAASEGSFSKSGETIDRNLALAAQSVAQNAASAADQVMNAAGHKG